MIRHCGISSSAARTEDNARDKGKQQKKCYADCECAEASHSRVLPTGAGFPLIQEPGIDFRRSEPLSARRSFPDSYSFPLLPRQPSRHAGCCPRLQAFLSNAVELVWIRRKQFLSPNQIVALTWATIAVNMAIAFALASISYRQDIQYFALMLAPILQAAFRLSLGATLVAVTTSSSLIFFWVWNYFSYILPV